MFKELFRKPVLLGESSVCNFFSFFQNFLSPDLLEENKARMLSFQNETREVFLNIKVKKE